MGTSNKSYRKIPKTSILYNPDISDIIAKYGGISDAEWQKIIAHYRYGSYLRCPIHGRQGAWDKAEDAVPHRDNLVCFYQKGVNSHGSHLMPITTHSVFGRLGLGTLGDAVLVSAVVREHPTMSAANIARQTGCKTILAQNIRRRALAAGIKKGGGVLEDLVPVEQYVYRPEAIGGKPIRK